MSETGAMIKFHTYDDWVRKAVPIRRASTVLPEWFEDMPVIDPKLDQRSEFARSVLVSGGQNVTAKHCMGIRGLFQSALVCPMWVDTWIFRGEGGGFRVKQINDPYPVDIHEEVQMRSWLPEHHAEGLRAIIKFNSPWRAFSQDYDLLQVPCFYHVENEFTSVTGTIPIELDGHSQLNVHVIPLKDKIFIKQGTPLVMWVPVPKGKVGFSLDEVTDDELARMNAYDALLAHTSSPSRYGKMKNQLREQARLDEQEAETAFDVEIEVGVKREG